MVVLSVRTPLPHLVNPEKYRLSGINPGDDFSPFGVGVEAGKSPNLLLGVKIYLANQPYIF
jgi:hypothetical protein